MKRYNARIFLAMSIEDMWETLTGQFVLVFDDGEIQTNWRETMYSAYAWEFHRTYPNTPLLLKHHVGFILNGKRLGSDTHLEILGNAMWSVHDYYTTGGVEDVVSFRDQLAEMVYRLTNRMYNDLSYRLEEYVTSMDITDFIEVMEHPKIKKANDEAEPTQESLEQVYREIETTLQDRTELPVNSIALAARSGLVSMGQVLQCLGPRGFLTDTDSHQFKHPVMRSYTKGMRTLYNSLVESRSAAKSLLFSKTPLQQAEYFSRRLQLMSQILRNLHTGDCGTQQYLKWTIRGPSFDRRGKEDRASDLKFMAGKYYLDDDGSLKLIRRNDKHLIGRTINLRSVLYCAHPDPNGICATCFGELALSVPRSTNIGHMCCTSMTQKSSQMVLSVKHLDGSSVVDSIEVMGDDRKYLTAGSDESSYLLASRLKGKTVKMVIPPDRAINMTDILEVKNVDTLNITRISELEEVEFIVNDGRIEERANCFVHLGRRLSSMTYQLLEYIAKWQWDIDDNGNYVIDLTNWDWSQPLLTLPLKHINMSDHSRDIAQMLESRVEDMHARDKVVSPDTFLVELFDLVNDKLNVNVAVLEVILYATMIRSAERFDYALPKPWTDRGLGVMKNSMAYRSGSATMAYEGHHEFITSPMSYLITNRPDHPFDAFLMPREVFKQ